MCMTTAFRPTRHVVQIIDALDVKGYMPACFDEREISSWFADLGEINNPAVGSNS